MFKLIAICVIIILVLLVIGLFIYIIHSQHQDYITLRTRWEKDFKEYFKEYYEKIAKLKEEYNLSKDEYGKELQSLLNEIEEKKQFNETLYKVREEELNTLIENKKKLEIEKISKEIDEWSASAQEAAQFCSETTQKAYEAERLKKEKELSELASTIDDYKARRDVINQEILRARAIEEQQDFYRIQIPESSKHDLDILQSIRKELTKVDILDKLLYDNYVKKPVDEMVKRVLQGENPSGIYKITRLKTGEIYIGKSVNIKDRWVQHAKSCYHCGTISHSILHTTLEKDGIENFTWELLEKVPKDKLGEREKYWIEFYDSKKYGLNMREG